MVYITRRMQFCAAHKLSIAEWTEEKNTAVFGLCANPNGHGHNYILEITIAGKPDPVTGFVVNLVDIKKIAQTYVIDKVDHKNLNLDVDFMKNIQPTTENFAIQIWKQLVDNIPPPSKLFEVKLIETENNFVIYRGE